jgi:AAA ATPase-like protein
LLGREHERGVLDRLLNGVRAGRGGALIMHGEAGVGKTALLEYAVEVGPEFRIARTIGVEAEMELPFAAAQQLCSPFFDLRERLPQPQHDALDVAFGLTTGPAPDRFLVGLAVLGLLAEAAEVPALACAVDDAQWLDNASARTMAFVARRLVAEKIALVFATRELGETLSGLPELGIPESAADTVESEELLALAPRVAFRHPLVRSAVYTSAEPNARRDVHRALADATDLEIDPDRRAWHRAQAAAAPDEEVAAELERSAARAQARGGLAAPSSGWKRQLAPPAPTGRWGSRLAYAHC